MSARKSRYSKPAREARERYGRGRKIDVRPSRPIIVVVCDDQKTARRYFECLKRHVKTSVTVRVIRNPFDRATAMDVVQCAHEELQRLREQSAPELEDKQSVWALIDLEANHAKRDAAQEAKKSGERLGVRVALSDPCYEVWTLLHLVNIGSRFDDCGQVLTRLYTEWRKVFTTEMGPKAQADFSKLIPDRVVDAIGNAKAQRECHAQSWTEVDLAVDEIRQAADGIL